MIKKDAFQINLNGRTFVIGRYVDESDLSGSWSIDQRLEGKVYKGTLKLKMSGKGSIEGTVEWDHHQGGRIEGEVSGNSITFRIHYSEDADALIGTYQATLSLNRTDMVDGTATSNKGGATVAWEAKKISQ